MDIINTTWIMGGFDLKTFKPVEREVRVTSIFDGPESDPRDYCSIEGWYDWPINIPLDNLLKQGRPLEAA